MFVLQLCMLKPTELEGDADDEQIKIAYRRLAKFYHPDGMYLILATCFIFSVLIMKLRTVFVNF